MTFQYSCLLIAYLFDTILKIINHPTFVSRFVTDTYIFFLWTCIRDIDMNYGIVLYNSVYQKELTIMLFDTLGDLQISQYVVSIESLSLIHHRA